MGVNPRITMTVQEWRKRSGDPESILQGLALFMAPDEAEIDTAAESVRKSCEAQGIELDGDIRSEIVDMLDEVYGEAVKEPVSEGYQEKMRKASGQIGMLREIVKTEWKGGKI